MLPSVARTAEEKVLFGCVLWFYLLCIERVEATAPSGRYTVEAPLPPVATPWHITLPLCLKASDLSTLHTQNIPIPCIKFSTTSSFP
jgi:hypothetical protein